MERAVIFDLDGTLVDSLGDIASAMNEVLERHGFPSHPLPAYRRFVGDGMERLVRRALPPVDEETVARVLEDMRGTYARHALRTTRPYPGVPDLLDRLAARGVPFAVLTNKPHDAAVAMVRALLGRWRFAAVRGAVPGRPRKPDPAGALEIARRLGVAPEGCLFVGDTPTDMATAGAAGMVPVGVLWGFRTEPELRGAGARFLLEQPLELPGLLGDRPRPPRADG